MDLNQFLISMQAKFPFSDSQLNILESNYAKDHFGCLKYFISKNLGHSALICSYFAKATGFELLNLNDTMFEKNVVKLLPEKLAKADHIIAVRKEKEIVIVALAEPDDIAKVQEAQRIIGMPIKPLFAPPWEIEHAIAVQYSSYSEMGEISKKLRKIVGLIQKEGEITQAQLTALAGEQAVQDFSHQIILLALKERASDIHIQPTQNELLIRFRIDGYLKTFIKLERDLHDPLVSTLKLQAGANIIEKRLPQDGRISVQLTMRELEIRFSSIPSVDGEKVVLRLLGQLDKIAAPKIETLGFSKRIEADLKKAISAPEGIFLVTGPTGSGKTTTLYGALNHLNNGDNNILTVEDPVEYRLNMLTQVQVNAEIGLDFATALRSFLRQDPDIILVGEIRDEETARIAAQAALNGHFVMATMHTNDALSSITRLIDIGIEPFLFAPSLVGVMAQRLVRRICKKCKEPYSPAPSLLKHYSLDDGKPVTFYKGKGCDNCHNSGFRGRVGIHEIFIIPDEMRNVLTKEPSIEELRKIAAKHNFRPLHEDGLEKVKLGLTTIEELHKICHFQVD